MKNQLETLIELQKIDLEQEKLHIEVDAKKHKVADNEEMLAELDAGLSKERDDVAETKRLLANKENELVETIKGIEHATEKLNAVGKIGSSRDYATIEQEGETFKKMKEQTEKEIEELKKSLADAEAVIEKHAAEYDNLRAENDKLAAEADAAEAAIEGKVNELKAQSAELGKKVRPDILARYRFIRQRRQGEAVVSASNGTCVGCHMKLQPQTYIRLQRQQTLECCQNCQRILYFNADEHISTHED